MPHEDCGIFIAKLESLKGVFYEKKDYNLCSDSCICSLCIQHHCLCKNFDISFTLTPNGSSGYSGTGYKVDSDPKCYITTTGGSVISNNLIYKCRGKAITSSGYADATELSDPAYQGAITS